MKRFLVTAPTYKGEAVLVYDESSILVCIDITQIEPRSTFSRFFFDNVPRYFHGYEKESGEKVMGLEEWLEGKKDVRIIQEDFEISFKEFWELYNKKINKLRCEPLWKKLNKDKKLKAYYGIKVYDRFLATSYRNKADPENYLRNEMWENEWK